MRTRLLAAPRRHAAARLAACGDNTGSRSGSSGAAAPKAEKRELPEKFQKPVKIAFVRQLASGDYFQQWLLGARQQTAALGIDMQV